MGFEVVALRFRRTASQKVASFVLGETAGKPTIPQFNHDMASYTAPTSEGQSA